MIAKPEQIKPGQVVEWPNGIELTVKIADSHCVYWEGAPRPTYFSDPIVWLLADLKVNKHEDLNHYVLDEKGRYKDKETFDCESSDLGSYAIEEILEWLEQDVAILRAALGKDSR